MPKTNRPKLEPWTMTFNDWQKRLEERLREQYPNADAKDIAKVMSFRELEWVRAVESHAAGHRLPDHVLDSYAAKYGKLQFLRTFRGNAGQTGYFFPDIRALPVNSLSHDR